MIGRPTPQDAGVMQRIRLSHLKPDQVLEQSLFSCGGQKLLNAGVTLTARHIDALSRSGEFEALMADSIEELIEAGILRDVDGSKITVGQKAQAGLVTRTGHVVVEAGEAVEEHHLDALKAGGRALASSADDKQSRRERILMGDALVEQLEIDAVTYNRRVAAGKTWLDTPAPDVLWPGPEELAAHRDACVHELRGLYARIEAGVSVPVSAFDKLIQTLIDQLRSHPSRFTQLALLCPRRHDYLPDHAYTVTVLAMATAAQMHWPIDEVRQLALAGLLFDVGMLLVPERIRTGAEQLSDIDRGRVQRHPVFSLSMLECVQGAPLSTRLAAYQHHERENGSGYPRGSRRDQIGDYARVLAVADTFAAATEPRHYRKPKLPYLAMEETLRATATMVFWKPAARALVQAAGLFPVGSYVKLSDSRNAHVVAANARAMDRPTVQPLDAQGLPKGEPIDLASVDKNELTVVRPIHGAVG